ncbi:helix-turn-helix transcriptional regulator [Sagittula sp. SSi028]|uniref:helix-turn-helix transcriptional regulator n=1 Tax=Sagittula sp. SSi028 TaxID=3400636 RepID=UPI003AF45414
MTPSLRDAMIELTHVDHVEDLWQRHCARMAEFGFDRLIYGFTRFLTPTSMGDPNDFIVLSNHSADYRKGFVEGGLYRHAPMVRWALANEGHCSWRVLAEQISSGALDKEAQKVVAFNLTHKVHAGYTISFKSVSRRAKGAISLTARADMTQDAVDALWQSHGKDIVLLNNLVHLKLLTLPVSLQNQTLTPRQREALEWVGDGKTMQDIAQIMGLTQATIEKHLRLARETLNVETTAQAVAKAAFHNQMYILEA